MEFIKPQINVEVNMGIERNNQKNVDNGSSPWLLDPAFVAQVWASLRILPGGIKGEYPISYKDVKMIYNNGKDAIAQIVGGKTVVKKVYLKKLVRQDPTGIWTVIGYDLK